MWGAAKSSQKGGWTRRLQSTLHWLDGKVCRDVWKVRLHSRVSAQNQECGQILHAVLLTPKQGGNRKGLWAGAISCIMQTLSHLHQWNWRKKRGGGGKKLCTSLGTKKKISLKNTWHHHFTYDATLCGISFGINTLSRCFLERGSALSYTATSTWGLHSGLLMLSNSAGNR